MADRLFVSNLRLSARLATRRVLSVDIDCAVDPSDGDADDPAALSHAALCDLAAEIAQSDAFGRAEALGERIAMETLRRFNWVREVRVRIGDSAAPTVARVDCVGVELTRVRSTPVAFSLGSNVGDKAANLRNALARLDAEPHIEIDAVSHFYKTEPWGKADQDWFVNACATARTSLRPRELLRRCKAIELQIGRTPGVRWGPRVIDIDLLFFGDETLQADDLTLPHPEMLNRAFVLAPLAEIAPDRIIAGQRIAEVAERLQRAAGEVARLDSPQA